MEVILAMCHWWIVGLWTLLLIYWLIAAMLMKRSDRSGLHAGVMMRLALAVTIVVAIGLARRSADLRLLQFDELQSIPMAFSGAIIATLGAILAVTARVVIGRNWAPPATRRTNTQLVTRGPYRLVRHPIYSGVLLMMTGTAIGLNAMWWLVAAATGIYFFYSARTEEKFMAERFPDSYPAYRARTKMLVPFLL